MDTRIRKSGASGTFRIADGGDGLRCFQGRTDNAGPPAWAAVASFSLADTSQARDFCASGKNWSGNRDRWFIVKATW
jgi:hypothetical protein